MKAWVISDLHVTLLDWLHGRLPVPTADACICAGDVSGNIYQSIDYLLSQVATHMPVVLVLGNHDYYGNSIDRTLEIARKQLIGTQVHLLENEALILGGVRFVGATLWTDFQVEHGRVDHNPELPMEIRRFRAIHKSLQSLADFRHIFRSDERKDGETGYLTVQEMIARHGESRRFLELELARPFDGPTVVVTHHAPSPQSFNPAYHGDATNGAFASDLTDIIETGVPEYWIHGHIHYFSDYLESSTRVLCNPRGYRHERSFVGSRLDLIIDI